MDWPVISAALGSAVSLCILIGLAVRFALLPWLERHLVSPVKETRKQVTENHHSNPRPTVLDRIDDVSKQVAENTRETRAMARMFDGHLEWSQHEVDRIWSRLEEDRRRKEEDR